MILSARNSIYGASSSESSGSQNPYLGQSNYDIVIVGPSNNSPYGVYGWDENTQSVYGYNLSRSTNYAVPYAYVSGNADGSKITVCPRGENAHLMEQAAHNTGARGIYQTGTVSLLGGLSGSPLPYEWAPNTTKEIQAIGIDWNSGASQWTAKTYGPTYNQRSSIGLGGVTVRWVQWSQNGDYFYLGGNLQPKVYSLIGNAITPTLVGNIVSTSEATLTGSTNKFGPNQYLATVSFSGGTVRLIRLSNEGASGTEIWTQTISGATNVKLSPDGKNMVVTSTSAPTVRIFDIDGNTVTTNASSSAISTAWGSAAAYGATWSWNSARLYLTSATGGGMFKRISPTQFNTSPVWGGVPVTSISTHPDALKCIGPAF